MTTRSLRSLWLVLLAAAALSAGALALASSPEEPGGEDSWARVRARGQETPFKARAEGAMAVPSGQLWRARPVELPLPDFSAPVSLAPLIREVSPGVVNISTLNGRPVDRSYPRGAVVRSLGSGLILSPDGYVVTNNHVVESAQQIRVKLSDGREFFGQVVGRDRATDIALLRLQGNVKALPFVFLGDSDKLEVGDWVAAIGNPFGLDHSVSHGIISAKERVIGIGIFDDFIQTDALINPGNSGGPLFNMRGEVIGVTTAIISQGQGIGFAVPINMVKDLIPNLKENGRLERGWLGVVISEQSLGDSQKGPVVQDVYAGSPAAVAGIQRGDRLMAVNDYPIESYLKLLRRVALLAPGNELRLKLQRHGMNRDVTVRLGERPAPETLEVLSSPGYSEQFGLVVRDLPQRGASSIGLPPSIGVLVAGVLPGSPAEQSGLKPGDVITELNKQRIQDVRGYKAAIDRTPPGQGPLVRYQRGDEIRYVAIEPG